ncbi:MAG: CAP domain-containing protein [Candidatus Bathyarchaeota archaeon]|nr:CAP domain-containing protein [Candidatus Bathyarchaeota archaeon]
MGLCYICGKDLEQPYRCPHCNLTFCEDHIAQRDHNCIAQSRKLKTSKSTTERETVPYVESVEAPTHRPKPQIRRKKGILDLGAGVTSRKVALVAITLAISLGSIMFLNSFNQPPDDPGTGPVFPTTPEVLELQEYVLDLINVERVKAGLEEVELDTNHIAQRYAESMLETGEFKHNPELPGTMGENIKYHTAREEFDENGVLEMMMYEMVYNDAEYEWGHRDNILNEDYERVSLGVAFDDENLYLVQDFS